MGPKLRYPAVHLLLQVCEAHCASPRCSCCNIPHDYPSHSLPFYSVIPLLCLLQLLHEGGSADVGWMVYRMIVTEVNTEFSSLLAKPVRLEQCECPAARAGMLQLDVLICMYKYVQYSAVSIMWLQSGPGFELPAPYH